MQFFNLEKYDLVNYIKSVTDDPESISQTLNWTYDICALITEYKIIKLDRKKSLYLIQLDKHYLNIEIVIENNVYTIDYKTRLIKFYNGQL